MMKDRGFMTALLRARRAVGCNVLVFTVDAPMPGGAISKEAAPALPHPGFLR